MRKEFSEEELIGKPLTEEQKEILALLEMRDEDIDTSDIPEVRELPPGAVRGKFYRGLIVRLNEELRQYFVELARRKGVPLNDPVNETLAKAIAMEELVR